MKLSDFINEKIKLENTQKLNGKLVNLDTVEISGLDMNDYPDFVDAKIIYAEYINGMKLSDKELAQLQSLEDGQVIRNIVDNKYM